MLTKKYYEMIAASLIGAAPFRGWSNESPQLVVERVALCLAAMCAADNPKFDRARFLKACGVSQ